VSDYKRETQAGAHLEENFGLGFNLAEAVGNKGAEHVALDFGIGSEALVGFFLGNAGVTVS